jgi:hypothetical protein
MVSVQTAIAQGSAQGCSKAERRRLNSKFWTTANADNFGGTLVASRDCVKYGAGNSPPLSAHLLAFVPWSTRSVRPRYPVQATIQPKVSTFGHQLQYPKLQLRFLNGMPQSSHSDEFSAESNET